MSASFRLVRLAIASVLGATVMSSAHALVVERMLGGGIKARTSSFELPGQTVEMRSFSPVGRGGVFMLVGARDEGAPASSVRLLSLQGAPSASSDVRSQALRAAGAETAGLGMADESPLAGSLLAVDDQGSPYTVAVALNGSVQLTRFGVSGRAEQAFKVDLPDRSVSIRRLVWMGSGEFMLVGSAGSRPLLVAVDRAGKLRQRYTVQEDDAAAVAVAAMPEGRLAVLIEKGSASDPGLSLVVLGQGGGVLHRAELSGRPIDLAVGSRGQIFVLVERRAVTTRDLVALTFSSNLVPATSRTLVGEKTLLGRFRVIPMLDGGVLVAGRKERGLWLARLSEQLAEVWTAWTDPRQSPEVEVTMDLDLARTADNVYVGYSAMVVRDRRQSSVVRVMQFPVD